MCARRNASGCRLDDLARGQQGSRDDHAGGRAPGRPGQRSVHRSSWRMLPRDNYRRGVGFVIVSRNGKRVTSGLPADSTVEFLVVPAAQFPEEVWPALMAREPVIIDSVLDGDDVTQIAVTTSASATGEEATALGAGGPSVDITDSLVRTVLVPGTTVVVAGGGPIADALIAQVSLLGWDVAVETRPDLVEGLTTRLSSADAVVVMGHDVETSSRCLQVALDSDAGYIGALGSRAMQQARADWLAYRDVTDLSRVHGPAGLDIGATTPEDRRVDRGPNRFSTRLTCEGLNKVREALAESAISVLSTSLGSRQRGHSLKKRLAWQSSPRVTRAEIRACLLWWRIPRRRAPRRPCGPGRSSSTSSKLRASQCRDRGRRIKSRVQIPMQTRSPSPCATPSPEARAPRPRNPEDLTHSYTN